MANAAPKRRLRGEDGGITIRKPRLGQHILNYPSAPTSSQLIVTLIVALKMIERS
jgi:hypothetical protein